MGTATTTLQVRDLDAMAYEPALALQRQLQQEVIDGRGTDSPVMHLLFVEHDPPVITISRRKGAREHLVANDSRLSQMGVEVAETDRGGDITYHGPGQLVVYPILDLNVLKLRLHSYMRALEGIVIETLARFQLTGERDVDATGVWLGGPPAPAAADGLPRIHGDRKICAMGVRVARWVSMHGLALNVSTNLQHFDLIVPCGLAGRGVTTMRQELGAQCPSMDDVKQDLAARFQTLIHNAAVS